MLDKIKKVFTKEKPETKSIKKKPLFDLGNELDSGVGVNETKSELKKEVTSENKSSLTFGK
tara:strand:+ start:79 stop:261 length:183 start_codon:yes stop_codon:yes gene_type:complete